MMETFTSHAGVTFMLMCNTHTCLKQQIALGLFGDIVAIAVFSCFVCFHLKKEFEIVHIDVQTTASAV